MIRHSQPQPQPQTTFCATLSSCQLQGCQKEDLSRLREKKRERWEKGKQRQRERKS